MKTNKDTETDMNRYLGDPNTDTYISQCPKPQPASLTTVGIVGKSTTPSDISKTMLRYFELKTSVYSNQEKSNEYTLVCFYPNSNHFKNTPRPKKHAMVFIFGHIIGVHSISMCVTVLIDDLVFLSSKGQIQQEETIGQKELMVVSPK